MKLVTIGFDLSLDTVERLVMAQEELDAPLRELGFNPRWLDAPEVRVSLMVLGPPKQEFLFDLADSISAVAEALVPFKVRLKGLAAHPSDDAPRLIHSEVDMGADLVTGLQKVLTVRLERLGIALDEPAFMPWVVLGRCRFEPGDEPKNVAETLGALADADFGESLVTSVILLEQQLGRKGADPSTVLRRFPLGKG